MVVLKRKTNLMLHQLIEILVWNEKHNYILKTIQKKSPYIKYLFTNSQLFSDKVHLVLNKNPSLFQVTLALRRILSFQKDK
jgi:hypothetical protein